eukprot:Partr_v1_DN25642_c0_g1_i2_m4775 putative Set and mynd domain containing
MELKTSEEKGRHQIATRYHGPGSLICRELMSSYATYASSNVCSVCFKPEPLNKCSGCRFQKYCSSTCQRVDWIECGHASECSLLKKRKGEPDALCRLVARLILKKDIGWSVDELECHLDRFDSEQLQILSRSAMVLKIYLPDDKLPSARDLSRSIAAMMSNQYSIASPDGLDVGLGCSRQISYINHSCDANSILVFVDRHVHLVATRAISAGEEITVAYCSETEPKASRRKMLESWNFTCKCRRCTAVGDKAVAYKCPNMSCKGTIDVPDEFVIRTCAGLDVETVNVECPKCQCVALSFEGTLQKYFDGCKLLKRSLDNSSKMLSSNDDARLVKLMGHLSELESILADTHHKLLEGRTSMLQLLLHLEMFPEALQCQQKILKAYEEFEISDYHPLMIYNTSQLAEIQTLNQNVSEAARLYRKAISNAAKIYPSGHWYLEEYLAPKLQQAEYLESTGRQYATR